MKVTLRRISYILAALIQFLLIEPVSAQLNVQAGKSINLARNSAIWNIDNLSNIGGYQISVLGNPVVKEFDECKAVEFDGIDDGLIVHGCPLNKESAFTIEMIFKPYSSFPNNIEQRFLHIQKPGLDSRRLLLELRLNDKNEWMADTHIRSDSAFLTCLAKDFPHPVNKWYHIALVYQNGVATHYVNGKKEMSGAVKYIPVDSASVSLGMRMNNRSFFKGAIRTVRMTPVALDSSDFLLPASPLQLIFSDDFSSGIKNWIAEFENPSSSKLSVERGKLDLSTSAGATVWYRNLLSGNIMITYDVTLIDSGGVNDRVSDLNAFWMAADPSNKNIFTRNGKFSSYDNLSLYYAGVGGHNNETTRFRKYFPNGEKPVIAEFLDKDHLLKGNKKYTVKIIVLNGRTSYSLNDKLFFDYTDKNPLKEGYFGFRTTFSHQQFGNFRVYRLPDTNNN